MHVGRQTESLTDLLENCSFVRSRPESRSARRGCRRCGRRWRCTARTARMISSPLSSMPCRSTLRAKAAAAAWRVVERLRRRVGQFDQAAADPWPCPIRPARSRRACSARARTAPLRRLAPDAPGRRRDWDCAASATSQSSAAIGLRRALVGRHATAARATEHQAAEHFHFRVASRLQEGFGACRVARQIARPGPKSSSGAIKPIGSSAVRRSRRN